MCRWLPICPCCGYRPRVKPFQEFPDWQSSLLTLKPSLKLRDLIIVGTHDSGSFSIPGSTLLSSMSITQGLTISGQLLAGVRFFDMRIGCRGKDPSKLVVMHGPHSGSCFLDMVTEIHDFLKVHQDEFVVMMVKEEKNKSMHIKVKQHVVENLHLQFGDTAINHQDRLDWFKPETVTIGEISRRNKKILIMGNSLLHNYPFLDKERADEEDMEALGTINV